MRDSRTSYLRINLQNPKQSLLSSELGEGTNRFIEILSTILTSAGNIVLIDEIENLIKREDGLSFSIDKEKKENEIQKFTEFYKKSNIKNKLLLNINGKNIDEVFNIITEFIGEVE